MPDELSTRYEPKAIEQNWYQFWEKGEFFTPERDRERPKFSIVIPPPNVTGRLHIGHALVNTLQDIIVRWKRMSGFNTLWLPGTDHAGIATQMIVDRELQKQGISRFDLGREKILPVANRRLPVIADPILVDPEFGTGVVKVTPAHDKNDYEAGKRNELPEIQVIDEAGKMSEAAGAEFVGLDRFEARLKVLDKLRQSGLLRDTKDYTNAV